MHTDSPKHDSVNSVVSAISTVCSAAITLTILASLPSTLPLVWVWVKSSV